MSEWSYDWTTRLLKQLGFHDLKEVETAIAPYDDHKVSVVAAEGARQGQLSRFELMLLAALGERFLERHPWRDAWLTDRRKGALRKFQQAGIKISTYNARPADAEGPSVHG